jgi:hypothetical protein
MAESPQQVISFLRDLARKARPFAEKDVADLRAFAAEHLGLPTRRPGTGPTSAKSSRKRATPSASRRSSSTSPRPRCWPACSRSSRRCSTCRSAATRRRCGTPPCSSTASNAAAAAGGPVLPGPARPQRQARRRLDGRRAHPLAAPRHRPCRPRWPTWCATLPTAWMASRAADARRRHHPVPRVRPRPAPHADPGERARRLGHQRRRVGRGGAAQPVHGELLLGMGAC